MAQMLPMVQIVPEMNFALDPVTGVIGSSLGSGVVLLSMDEVNEQVAKVELAADELMASLDPYSSPVGSYPGREGSYITAGLLTNTVYGFLLATFIIFAALPILNSQGEYLDTITEGDILTLTMMLNKELKKANKECETSVDIYLSRKVNMKRKTNGSLICCYLYVNSHYFTRRECISFNYDGFIGFAGWADQGNTNPILRAFLKWCDYLAESEVRNE